MSYGAIQSRVDCNFVKVYESSNANSGTSNRKITFDVIPSTGLAVDKIPQFVIIKVDIEGTATNKAYTAGKTGFLTLTLEYGGDNSHGFFKINNGTFEKTYDFHLQQDYLFGPRYQYNYGIEDDYYMFTAEFINSPNFSFETPFRYITAQQQWYLGNPDNYVPNFILNANDFASWSYNLKWSLWVGSPFQTISDT